MFLVLGQRVALLLWTIEKLMNSFLFSLAFFFFHRIKTKVTRVILVFEVHDAGRLLQTYHSPEIMFVFSVSRVLSVRSVMFTLLPLSPVQDRRFHFTCPAL